MTDKTGGPAFPVNDTYHGGGMGNIERGEPGMTLRDYFAAKAMHSIRSGPEWQLMEMKTIAAENSVDVEVVIASFAYKQADAMLKAREVSHD